MRNTISLFALLLLAGCSPITVHHDYDPNEDFSTLRRWAFASSPTPATGSNSQVSGLTYDRIRRAIEDQLTLKGYQKLDSNPDFLVRTHAGAGQKLEVEPGYGYGWGYGNQVQAVDEGTLVIDILSVKEKRLVWRGTGSGALDPNLDPEQRDARIRETVQKILADFPPKPGSH
jgi:hypothetical protein